MRKSGAGDWSKMIFVEKKCKTVTEAGHRKHGARYQRKGKTSHLIYLSSLSSL